jgi:N-methylhydantoinase A
MIGPLLARELEIREVIVPVAPAAFSAWGMLSAEIVDDFARTELRRLDELGPDTAEALFAALEAEARGSLAAQAVPADAVVLERQLDLRYEGQEHSLPLTLDGRFDADGVRAAFEREHELRYGHVMDAPVQVLTARVRGAARAPDVRLERAAAAAGPVADALLGRRRAWCFARAGEVEFAVYERGRLGAGHAFAGPAIVDEGTSTTVVMSDQSVQVDEYGQLLVAGGRPA